MYKILVLSMDLEVFFWYRVCKLLVLRADFDRVKSNQASKFEESFWIKKADSQISRDVWAAV